MANLDELITMIGGKKSEEMSKTDRLKVAVCGQRKVGKSLMVAKTARKPLLHYDFDDRCESIAGQEGVIIKTLVDNNTDNPTAWSLVDSDIASLTYLKTKGPLPIRSICFDSMTFLRKYAENQMMKNTNLKRTKIVNGKNIQIAQGFDAITATRNMIYTLLRDTFALGVDVYTIWHLIPEKDKARSEKVTNDRGDVTEITAYTGRYVVDPQHLDEVLSIFNEVWRCYIDASNDFKIQVRPDEYFGAATTLQNVAQVENQDIAELLRKHGV